MKDFRIVTIHKPNHFTNGYVHSAILTPAPAEIQLRYDTPGDIKSIIY